MKLDLIGPQKQSVSVAINNQLTQNTYLIKSEGSRSGWALISAPGSAVFSSTTGTMRGCYEAGGVSYFVIGTVLYSIDSGGTATNQGTIAGSSRVSIEFDDTSLIICNGSTTVYYFNTSTSTLTSQTAPYIAHTVTMLDTYAIFSGPENRMFISAVGDTDSFDALDSRTIKSSPGDLLAVWQDHTELFCFKEKNTEVYVNTGAVSFAFEENQSGKIERGLYARFAVAQADNTLFFLGDDLIVYRLDGYTPVKISDESTDVTLSNLQRDGHETDLTNAFMFVYTDHGDKFLQLTVPNRTTLVYSFATQQWFTKKHNSYLTHHAVCYCYAYGKHLIGGLDGKVYEMSRAYYADDTSDLVRKRRSRVYQQDDRRLHWKSIKCLLDFGSTTVSSGQGSNPTFILRWSDDYGQTFKNDKPLPLGATGEYGTKAIKRNCGSSRNRVIELECSDPVPFTLVDAYATIR